jgi:hypothetical protein
MMSSKLVCVTLALGLSAFACGGKIADPAPEPLKPFEPLPPEPIPSDTTTPPGSGQPSIPSTSPSSDKPGTATVSELGGCAYRVVIVDSVSDVDLAKLLGNPSCAANVTVTISDGARVGAKSTDHAAFVIAKLAAGSTVTIENHGRIVGAGGAGGSGGNGGSGGSPRNCGRQGADGGPALRVEVPTKFELQGEIFGGGGGGGGASGGNDAFGGGGGAGFTPGEGGAPASTLSEEEELAFCGQDNNIREGTPGKPGTTTRGGAAIADQYGSCRSGAGGAFGLPGTSSDCYGGATGGKAGHAIDIVGQGSINITAGTYATGVGTIRGAVVKL